MTVHAAWRVSWRAWCHSQGKQYATAFVCGNRHERRGHTMASSATLLLLALALVALAAPLPALAHSLRPAAASHVEAEEGVGAGPVRCTSCKTLVKTAERILKQPSTKENITQHLNQYCIHPPPKVVNICNETIEEVYVVLVQDLIELLDSPPVVGNVTENVGPLCRIVPSFFYNACLALIGRVWEGIVHEIGNVLEERQDQIVARLDTICTEPPEKLVLACEDLISRLYDWGVSLSPATVCEKAGACTKG
eukprot:TRINITY_DN5506_c0_g1_i2.p1 TRINITY_DN5506_c0_g1~~TRINITY_DN5506_c0_g1_i2.p1  ORF type:complete len:251 (-),score=50.37 TRINITY_DN5506_c0_g1_i2:156-908(-)